MRISNVVVAAMCVAAITSDAAGAQGRSALAISQGSVVRLRQQSGAPCADSGSVIAVRRDSAVVEMPLAKAGATGVVDCSLFSRRVVSIASLDVWKGPKQGARRGMLWGLVLGAPVGGLLGGLADSQAHSSNRGFGMPVGAVLGFFLGPMVGGVVGAMRASDEWTPATVAGTP